MRKWIDKKLIPFLTNREKKNGIHVIGPLHMDKPEERALLERALAFRRKQNLVRASYLETSAQREVEERLGLDQRSAHFVAQSGDELLVTMRVTPAPFEVDSLVPGLRLSERPEYKDYWEAGRLCTAIELQRKGRIASQVMATALVWAILRPSFRGGVALCKREKVPFLCRFGFKCIAENVCIPSRGDDYAVLVASRKDLLRGLWAFVVRKSTRTPRTHTIARIEP